MFNKSLWNVSIKAWAYVIYDAGWPKTDKRYFAVESNENCPKDSIKSLLEKPQISGIQTNAFVEIMIFSK